MTADDAKKDDLRFGHCRVEMTRVGSMADLFVGDSRRERSDNPVALPGRLDFPYQDVRFIGGWMSDVYHRPVNLCSWLVLSVPLNKDLEF